MLQVSSHTSAVVYLQRLDSFAAPTKRFSLKGKPAPEPAQGKAPFL